MILKFLAVTVVLFLVYTLFFKKNREKSMDSSNKSNQKDNIEDIMVECPTCGTYVSKKEAILSNGNYYCSKECLENK
ncbi:PP0621 family protein [Arcobacter sp. CECT 8985]|uniref:PP0621 family protein n=1 Tax=Arcobacter sp. CECT 8985 TaxID=1935424 RepID=UPI00100AB642|nr:PP0621 family protein [Arcobacter sp. CECT 8985]RXJ87577.1 hypothetical protein CRU93_03310 [Arcobacter sp. CECT 8985]